MEITTTTIHELRWDFPDANEFNATITNGKITELHFRDVGDLTNNDLCSVNEKYLRNIHKALKGLFQHLDNIRNVGNVHFVDGDDEEEEDAVLARFKDQIKSVEYARGSEGDKDFEDKIIFIKQ